MCRVSRLIFHDSLVGRSVDWLVFLRRSAGDDVLALPADVIPADAIPSLPESSPVFFPSLLMISSFSLGYYAVCHPWVSSTLDGLFRRRSSADEGHQLTAHTASRQLVASWWSWHPRWEARRQRCNFLHREHGVVTTVALGVLEVGLLIQKWAACVLSAL